MSWVYVIRSGELWHSGQRIAIGYAGWDDGNVYFYGDASLAPSDILYINSGLVSWDGQ